MDFDYFWDLQGPYDITPKEGSIKVGEKSTFTVAFMPKEAGVWQVNALITATRDSNKDTGINYLLYEFIILLFYYFVFIIVILFFYFLFCLIR